MMHHGWGLPSVRALIVTARRALEDCEEDLLFAAPSDCHVKPLAPEQLVRIVRRMLANPPAPFRFWDSSFDRRDPQSHRCLTRVPRDAAPMCCDLAPEESMQ